MLCAGGVWGCGAGAGKLCVGFGPVGTGLGSTIAPSFTSSTNGGGGEGMIGIGSIGMPGGGGDGMIGIGSMGMPGGGREWMIGIGIGSMKKGSTNNESPSIWEEGRRCTGSLSVCANDTVKESIIGRRKRRSVEAVLLQVCRTAMDIWLLLVSCCSVLCVSLQGCPVRGHIYRERLCEIIW